MLSNSSKVRTLSFQESLFSAVVSPIKTAFSGILTPSASSSTKLPYLYENICSKSNPSAYLKPRPLPIHILKIASATPPMQGVYALSAFPSLIKAFT